MTLRIFLSAACLAFVQSSSWAQDLQARAQSLLQHARQLSDIRSAGAPAFRLQATFSYLGDGLESVEGTYTETWVSASQWRRETVIGDLRHVEIGGPGKRWVIYPDEFPLQASQLPTLMAASPPASLELDFASISDRVAGDVTAECAYSKPAVEDHAFTFCFDKKSGVLLEKVFPEKRARNLVSFSCEYGTFRKFGSYWFPREVACFDDRHKTISANVVGLSIEPPMDPALFDAPAGAIELTQCSGKTIPPTLSGRDVRFPGLDLDRVAWITVWFVVDSKGKTRDIKLLRSAGKGSHEKALETVRNWRFNPGRCDGKALSMQMTMQIPSTAR